MTAVAPSRHRHTALRLLAVAVTSTALSCPAFAEEKSLPQQIVETLNKLSGGPHAGFRANHAKGIVVTGSFAAAPTGKSVTKASHVQPGVKVPVIVRFSNPTGVPNLPDASPYASPHGIAIRFNLPDGSFTDIVSISFNGFPVSTPEDFLGLLQAVATSGPDTPSPKPI